MKNITISVREELLESVKARARAMKLSVNAYIRGLLEQDSHEIAGDWYLRLEEAMDNAGAVHSDWKWSREEVYEERMARYDRTEKM